MPNNISEDFRDFIMGRGTHLYQYENGAIQQMVEPYNKAKIELTARLEKVQAQSIGYTKEWRISRLNAQLGEIEGMLQAAAYESGGNLERILSEFAYLEAEVYSEMLRNNLGPIGVNIRNLPMRQIDFITQESLIYKYRGITPKDAMLWGNNEVVNSMRTILTQTIIQGEDMRKAANRLVGLGDRIGGEVGKMIQNKASIIARSEIQHVSNEVARASYKENMDVLDGVTYLAALDNRTCVVCAADDGRVFRYKKGEDHNGPILPRHPFCRCFYSPKTKSWKQLEKEFPREPGVKLTEKQKDYYSAKPLDAITYQKWLRGKEDKFITSISSSDSAAFKKWMSSNSIVYPETLPYNEAIEALGKARYKLWRSGKLSLKEMAQSNKILTLEQLEAKIKLKNARLKALRPKLEPEKVIKKGVSEYGVELTNAQKQALAFADEVGAINEQTIGWMESWYGLTREEVLQLSKIFDESIGKDIGIHINRKLWKGSQSYDDLYKTGKMKNQFQLAAEGMKITSGGYTAPYKGFARDSWESNITNGVLQSNKAYAKIEYNGILSKNLAQERPIYGYINDKGRNYLNGQYGNVVFKLKSEVRNRMTLTISNSGGFSSVQNVKNRKAVLTPKNNAGLIQEFAKDADDRRKIVKDILKAGKIDSGFTKPYGYIESQIYGGIDLKRDVSEIIVNSGSGYSHIKELGNKYGIKVTFVE